MIPLLRLVDDVGVISHSNGALPDRSRGYRTSDAGRALGLAAMLPSDLASPEVADRCLAQLQRSLTENRQFAIGLDSAGEPINGADIDDSATGHAVWGLALAATSALPSATRDWAADILRLFRSFQSAYPRAAAHAVIAGSTLLHSDVEPTLGEDLLLRNIQHMPRAGLSRSWIWPEVCLDYGNGILAESLLHAGTALGNAQLVRDGLAQLAWLVERETAIDGHFSFVPVDGRGPNHVSVFDQRPLESWTTASACVTAQSIEPDRRWVGGVERAAEWFAGRNDAHLPMWDHETGAAFDALTIDGINENEGAEATIAFIGTLIERDRMKQAAAVPTIRLPWPRFSTSA
jgi:hypothetical protein